MRARNWTGRWPLALWIALLASLAVASAPVGEQRGGGKKKDRVLAWVSAYRHKVGNALTGQVLEHEYTLANRSDRSITIDGWNTNNDCIQLAATLRTAAGEHPFQVPAALAPGDEIALRMTVDTAGLVGALGFSAGVLTAEKLTLPKAQMSVRILPLFRFDPMTCSFDQLRPTGRPVRELALSNPLGMPFRPRFDEAKLPSGVTLACTPIDPDDTGLAPSWKVRVAVTERPTAKTFPAQVRFEATLAEHPDFVAPDGTARTEHVFDLALQAKFKDWVFARPSQLDLGRCAPSCARELQLRTVDPDFELALDAEDFRFENSAGELDWSSAAKVEISPIGTDRTRVNLSVRVSTPTPLQAEAQGRLIIRIGHPDLPELRIPISVHP